VKQEDAIEQLSAHILDAKDQLCAEIDVGGLLARNNTTHKWKVTFRTLLLRELVAWRFYDLMEQIVLLEKRKHFLGSRILIRSSIETLAMLIFLNQKMVNIVTTGDGFHEYSLKTEQLLLGSKNNFTSHDAISILNVLDKCKVRYPELITAYDELSETAHPNWDSLLGTYATTDKKKFTTYFENRVAKRFEHYQVSLIRLLFAVFDIEYGNRWIENFQKFEKWIEKHDQKLEESKPVD